MVSKKRMKNRNACVMSGQEIHHCLQPVAACDVAAASVIRAGGRLLASQLRSVQECDCGIDTKFGICTVLTLIGVQHLCNRTRALTNSDQPSMKSASTTLLRPSHAFFVRAMHFTYPLPVVPFITDRSPQLRLHRRPALHAAKCNPTAEVSGGPDSGLDHLRIRE
jgi:hypothetical protein